MTNSDQQRIQATVAKARGGVEEMGTCRSKGTNFWLQSDEQIWDVMWSMVSVANNSASYTWMLLEEILNVLTTNKK